MKYDIPESMYADGSSETVKLPSGYSARIVLEYDSDMGPPWEEHDGHGPVSDWRPKDSKAPGERILCEDRGSCRFYDFAAAVELAKKDGWDAPPYTGTKGERAVRAVEADFAHLRGWATDQWRWIGVCVTLLRDGNKVCSESLWGIESEGDYWRTVAEELIDECLARDAENVRRREVEKAFV